jgi:hypothetical protein
MSGRERSAWHEQSAALQWSLAAATRTKELDSALSLHTHTAQQQKAAVPARNRLLLL